MCFGFLTPLLAYSAFTFVIGAHHSCSSCDPNAECIKGVCSCLTGFVGNGKVCEGMENIIMVLAMVTASSNSNLFKVNNESTRIKSEICSKITIKTPERRH